MLAGEVQVLVRRSRSRFRMIGGVVRSAEAFSQQPNTAGPEKSHQHTIKYRLREELGEAFLSLSDLIPFPLSKIPGLCVVGPELHP